MSRNRRVLIFEELKAEKGIPYTNQHLGRLERAGLFPRRIKIGLRRNGWFEDEIDDHLERAAQARAA